MTLYSEIMAGALKVLRLSLHLEIEQVAAFAGLSITEWAQWEQSLRFTNMGRAFSAVRGCERVVKGGNQLSFLLNQA